jgi:hypothetical protein
MLPTNAFAFKEWAAICAALAGGRQTILIRKGGIHEGRDGFRVAHDAFWLFPTYLHEAAAGLTEEGKPFLERALAERPAAGTLNIAQYAVVNDVFEVRDENRLVSLAGEHIWSPRTISDRFHYRQPGLFLLIVRIHVRPQPIVIPDSPHFAGCRSWVELPGELPTEGLLPVLSDEEFSRRREIVMSALTAPLVL